MQAIPLCVYCKHKLSGELRCAAFPVRIPDAILQAKVDHREAVVGDEGIRFEARPGLDEARQASLAAILKAHDQLHVPTAG